MTWFYDLFIIFLGISIAISIYLIARLGTVRKTPGAGNLIWAIACVIVWSFAYIFEIFFKEYAIKLFWSKVEYAGIPFLSLAIFTFAVVYSGHGKWLTRNRYILLGVIPAITFLLAVTNDLHLLLWSSVQMPAGTGIGPLLVGHGPWYAINVFYSYALILLATFFLAQMAVRSHNLYRSQAVVMLVGLIIPWISNFIYIFRLTPFAALDLTPLAFTLTVIALEIGFARFGLMDIIPIAESLIFSAIQDGVIVADSKGRVIEINPAAEAIFQLQGGRLIGVDIRTVLPGWGEWNQAEVTQTDRVHEISLGEGTGQRCDNLRITPIHSRRIQLRGQVVTLTDVTDQKRAEEQLKLAHKDAVEANRMKTQLLASVSHDLRSPLGAIMGYAEMIQSGAFGAPTPQQKSAAIEILAGTNQLLVFVNNLISQAQIETGHVVLKVEAFDPMELLEAVRSTVSFNIQKKGLSMETEIDLQLPPLIKGDSYWLKQILLNLANNAVKFTETGSIKTKLFKYDRTHWAIQVADTGLGIPKDDQQIIFEAFRQVENPPERRFGGSGLGLSIVKQLVTTMEGRIELQSDVGRGSTFTVILPLLSDTENMYTGALDPSHLP